jgi:aspartyl protease family protein
MNYTSIILTFFIYLSLSSCSGCSQSGKRNPIKASRIPKVEETTGKIKEPTTVLKMDKINGVYQIPVEVNGVKMFFIFDTGASIISISETEANFLWKQGKLSKDDIRGTMNFSDANGDISEGTIIILSTVKIGDRVLTNIEASVVHNLNAPLLFGQSALEKFGKISIDYKNGEIIFY